MDQHAIAEASAIGRRDGRAWYASSIEGFLNTEANDVLGSLTVNSGLSGFAVDPEQARAWIHQIDFLKSCLKGLQGSVLLEFTIPRMGRRIDVVLLLGSAVFVLEFKVGATTFDRSSLDQVWDYALDLKNFHKASHAVPIIPILIATEAKSVPESPIRKGADNLYEPLRSNNSGLRRLLESLAQHFTGGTLDLPTWSSAPYHPTPTIVEAARSLYSRHSVEDIAKHDAATNLSVTSRRVEDIVEAARSHGRKAICFVTGVPGAGKTLVGLNVATRHRRKDEPTHAVFLSGNGPLVAVLSEALARDEIARLEKAGRSVRKGDVRESIKAFIQNVHHFRDDGLRDEVNPPFEHVVIFDEAQRAWNQQQTANFMARKKKVVGFSKSEPEFLISYMDRHKDWAVIICLVGGGQEINRGEAGIEAWLDAVQSSFPNWDVYISPRLSDSEYAAGHAIDRLSGRSGVYFDDALHLSVPMRSYRAETVSGFVKALLDCDVSAARELLRQASRYPLAITRDLNKAKEWIRSKARGSERYGLLASSKAQRLKPHAIDIRVNIDPVHWFLNDKEDTRSSYYLEDAATEFQVQGLEVDWACVTWDGDLRHREDACWSFHDFRGSRWCNVGNRYNQQYLKNAYRVLLTRARQGMVIFVPPGNDADTTRKPQYYDATYDYLRSLGIPAID